MLHRPPKLNDCLLYLHQFTKPHLPVRECRLQPSSKGLVKPGNYAMRKGVMICQSKNSWDGKAVSSTGLPLRSSSCFMVAAVTPRS
jgi:hypothetical protein